MELGYWDWDPRDGWELIPLGIMAAIVYTGAISVLSLIFLTAIGVVCAPLQSRLNALVASTGYRRRYVCLRFLIPWAYLLPASDSGWPLRHRPASREIGLHLLWFIGTVALSGGFALSTVFIHTYAMLGGGSVDLPDDPTRAIGLGLISILTPGVFAVFAFRAWLSSVRRARNDYRSAENQLIYSTLSAYATPFRRAVLWTCGSVALIIATVSFPHWTIFSDRF